MKKIFHVYFSVIRSPESFQFHDLRDRNSVYSYWIMVKHIIMLHVYSCNTCKYNYKCLLIGMLSIWALLLKKSLLLSGHISIYSTVTAVVFRVYNVKPSSAIVLWAVLTRHQCKVFYTRVTALVFLAVL